MGIFDNVESIFINDKEVQSIVLADSGGVLYEKETQEPLVFTFSGTTLEQNSRGSFNGTDMIIDYGDGTIESTTGKFGHTYNESGIYQVKIYGVTSLGNNCFKQCSGLTSITIPDNVTSLGNDCFSQCKELTSITIPDNVTSLGSHCFNNCEGLTSIILSNNITSLKSTFRYCKQLTSIILPDSITSLEGSCFEGCISLTSITIPDSVTSIGNSCFVDCTGLTSITIPDSITRLGDGCFNNCTNLTSIILNWTGTDILTYNSNWITDANSNLKFKIPEGTTQLYIDKGYPEDKLEEQSVVTLTVTGSSFSTNSSTSFTYNDKVFVDWGDNTGLIEYNGGQLSHTFNDGLNSHTVKIYGDLTSFGSYCFRQCTGLTSITIPNSITSLEDGCFNGCTGLTSVVIPNSVTSLRAACFSQCTSLTSITIPDSVISLGHYCFDSCTGLTSIIIPDSVTSLESACFGSCTSLTSIVIPNSVTNLKEYCFANCTSLTSISLNWTGTDILTYNSNWIIDANSNLKFKIPAGTKQLYINKCYPTDKLEERVT